MAKPNKQRATVYCRRQAAPVTRMNRCDERLQEVKVGSKCSKEGNMIIPTISFSRIHPALSPQAVLAFAQDLFLFNAFIASQPRFQDPRYQAYCVDKFHKFLALQKDFPYTALVPTACIDLVLQAHLIRPKMFQCVLDSLKMNLPERTAGFAVANKETLAATAYLWTAKYGESYEDLPAAPESLPEAPAGISTRSKTKKQKLGITVDLEFDLTADIAMYQDFGVKETDFFAITNDQYAQAVAPHLHSADVVSLVTTYAQDCEPGEALCAAYQRLLQWIVYLSQMKGRGSATFVPAGLVDYVWHAHMLQHSAYCEFSKDLLGHLLAHEPSPNQPQPQGLDPHREAFFRRFKHRLDDPLAVECHPPVDNTDQLTASLSQAVKCVRCRAQIPAASTYSIIDS